MAIWSEKQYNRINWKNRPSTTTPLGQTNLNKVDVFCNSVDNALIQFDAQKLNISVANSMLASVAYNDDTGVWTFKTLAGTTYTFNQNIEKIPVSFTLAEDGVLVMTTEDGTEWECNIADLIKDYVFDDSETVAFEKEFVGTDDDGKGSYHVSASVKAGSINEMHLNPDYRADILTYKTQAQEAANDSLTYSKDSKRWAVGDAEYEGSATDNSKYYKEQAEAAKKAAEQARDEAQAATGAVIATTTQLGVVKPDGTTIGVEEDGTIKSIIKAASLLITDNQELVVEKQGEVAQETTTQALIDAIADKVANQLVTNTALTSQLANYVTKAMMSNVQVNDQNKVPTSALAYAMQQQITENEEAITGLNSDIDNMAFNGSDLTLDELLDHYSVYSLPYIFGIDYTSNTSPDKNNTICIAIRNSIFAFSYSGKIFLANYGSNGWREINYMQSSAINAFDFNDPTYDAGSYRLGSNDHMLNSPSDSLEYGNVLIIKQNDYNGADTLAMLAFPYYDQGTYYYKSGNYQNWQSNKWFKFQGTELSAT